MLWLRSIGPLALLAAAYAVACSSSSSSGPSCAELTSEAQNAVFDATPSTDTADFSCKTDSDCVVASNSSACWNACGVVVNQVGATRVEAAVAQANATTCATFNSDGCKPNPAPPCAPLMPSCVEGMCHDGPGPGDDGGGAAGDAAGE